MYENQFGGADNGALQEALLKKKAEMVGKVMAGGVVEGGKSLKGDALLAVKSTSSGKVQDVMFLDHDTCMWQQAMQESIGSNSFDTCEGIRYLNRMSIRGITKHCWVVVACENKVMLHDLSSAQSHDIPRSFLESKSPTRVAALVYNSRRLLGNLVQAEKEGEHAEYVAQPILAIGSSAGSIYLTNQNGHVYAKCAGGHTKSVTAMQVIGPAVPGGPDRLVSASADGSIAVWDPSHSAKSLKSGDISPVNVFKAHEGGVFDLAVFGVPFVSDEGRLLLNPHIASVGANKQISVWDTKNWMETYMPLQALAKSPLTAVSSTMSGGIGVGSKPPLVGIAGDSCSVFALDPKESNVSEIINIQDLVDKGEKKQPKMYHIQVNITNPSLFALATNTGVVLIQDNEACAPGSLTINSQGMFLHIYEKIRSKLVDEKEVSDDPEEEQKAEGKDSQKEEPLPQGLTSISVVNDSLVASIYKMDIDKR